VLLAYRLPREPSTPRIALWRKLRRLGVAQLSDGLVALPHDRRTREALEWLAEEVVEAGGDATLWLAKPASRSQERALAERMAVAVAGEYRHVLEQAFAAREADPQTRRRTLARLRRELQRIRRRDFLPPPDREEAEAAVAELAATLEEAMPR
jgi:glutathione S-transferase